MPQSERTLERFIRAISDITSIYPRYLRETIRFRRAGPPRLIAPRRNSRLLNIDAAYAPQRTYPTAMRSQSYATVVIRVQLITYLKHELLDGINSDIAIE